MSTNQTPTAAQRDELLQAALDFIGTLTGMTPPPIEVAPPEVFAPFYAFVDRIQAITAQPNTALADRWVSVEEQLPEPGRPVLLDIGLKTPIRAMWAAKNTVEAGDECPADWAEYDEASDTYYCPEGWYEWNQYEETHWAVSRKAVAWMPLPAPPTLNASKEAGNG